MNKSNIKIALFAAGAGVGLMLSLKLLFDGNLLVGGFMFLLARFMVSSMFFQESKYYTEHNYY